MFTVYAISSTSRNYIYVGFTNDLERRLNDHNKGYNKTTKPYAPFILLYTEECETSELARVREKYFKSGIGKSKLKLIRDNL